MIKIHREFHLTSEDKFLTDEKNKCIENDLFQHGCFVVFM
jgi:hypothetical protein